MVMLPDAMATATSSAPACRAVLAGTIAALSATAGTAAAHNAELLHTNEAYVQEVTRPGGVVITDPMSVFAFVLGSLPQRV